MMKKITGFPIGMGDRCHRASEENFILAEIKLICVGRGDLNGLFLFGQKDFSYFMNFYKIFIDGFEYLAIFFILRIELT